MADVDAKAFAALQHQLAECRRQLSAKEEENLAVTKELKELRQPNPAQGGKTWFGRKDKKVAQPSSDLDAVHQMEAQLGPLKMDIRRLQEENAALKDKLACQKEWTSRDEYIAGLQSEVAFLKQGLEQEKERFKQKDEDFMRLLEETMERSSKDMEEMNRLTQQVSKLSQAKQDAEDRGRELTEAQRLVRRLEQEVAFMTTASATNNKLPASPGSEDKPPAPSQNHETVLAQWRGDLQRLEAEVQAKTALVAEQQGELGMLREAKAKNSSRIEELEGRQRANRQEIQNLVKVIKDLQSTHAVLSQSSKALEDELAGARATNLAKAQELEGRAAELRLLRDDLRRDGQAWVREAVVQQELLGGLERRLLLAERTKADAHVKRLEHELQEKTEECEALEEQLEELQAEALQAVHQPQDTASTSSTKTKKSVFGGASKPFKDLGKNISKLKPKDKSKDDIKEMKKLVQETLQRNIDLEAENKWLKEHARPLGKRESATPTPTP